MASNFPGAIQIVTNIYNDYELHLSTQRAKPIWPSSLNVNLVTFTQPMMRHPEWS